MTQKEIQVRRDVPSSETDVLLLADTGLSLPSLLARLRPALDHRRLAAERPRARSKDHLVVLPAVAEERYLEPRGREGREEGVLRRRPEHWLHVRPALQVAVGGRADARHIQVPCRVGWRTQVVARAHKASDWDGDVDADVCAARVRAGGRVVKSAGLDAPGRSASRGEAHGSGLPV